MKKWKAVLGVKSGLAASMVGLTTAAVAGGIALNISQASARALGEQEAAQDKYTAAQAEMRKARELLRQYLDGKPTGAHGYFAERQLKGLESLVPKDEEIAPIPFSSNITWRVLTVEVHDGYTTVKLEFCNTNPSVNESFSGFDQNPLVVVANNHLYKMTSQGFKLPVTMSRDSGYWVLQGGVTQTIDVNFEGFDEDINEGVVRYARGGQGYKFNRLNIKQIKPL